MAERAHVLTDNDHAAVGAPETIDEFAESINVSGPITELHPTFGLVGIPIRLTNAFWGIHLHDPGGRAIEHPLQLDVTE
jgi:hypothetical protein